MVPVIKAAGSREDDAAPATDNAISAVGKICRHVLIPAGKFNEASQILSMWLSWLPLTADVEENRSVMKDLLWLLSGHRDLLLPPGVEQMSRKANVREVLLHCLNNPESELIDEADVPAAQNVVQLLQ